MKLIKLGAVAAVLMSILTGCSESADLSPSNKAITQVIDVRTAGEFAEGHVDGAINIDVEALNFGDQIATLDKSGTYLVYCRTGRRSAIAFQQMSDAGFTVLDGNGLSDMEGRGWQFVQ